MTDLYDSIVLKDIFWRGQVRDVDALNRLLEYIVLNSSQTFSPTSIAKYFESVNRKVAIENRETDKAREISKRHLNRYTENINSIGILSEFMKQYYGGTPYIPNVIMTQEEIEKYPW